MLSLKNVSAGYDGIDVIHNISLDLRPGENLCVLGPNGCGKTTLVKAISGIIESRGIITINNKKVCEMKRKELASNMAVMSQISSVYFSYSVYETVLLGRYVHMKGSSLRGPSKKDKEYTMECMKKVGLYDIKDKQINTLSGGQLQRVYLARTLAQEPNVILLDEPTNHLDLKHQTGLIDFLKVWSKTDNHSVIGVLHDINLALRLADTVLLMKDGNTIAYGKTEEVINPQILTEVYDMDVVGYMIESLNTWKALKDISLSGNEFGRIKSEKRCI